MELYTDSKAEKSMEDSILEIYKRANKIVSAHCKLNKAAMSAMHALGYNGFKRWHRYRSSQFYHICLWLENEAFDKFRVQGNFKGDEVSYSPSDMQEHLRSWDKALVEGSAELGDLQKELFNLTGDKSLAFEKALEILEKDFKRTGRLLKRFYESDWLALDMHTADEAIHAKYKKKEAMQWNSLTRMNCATTLGIY